MLLLLNNVHEKTSHEVKTDKILKACARAICNLHAWYNFAPVLHESALVFSQSGTRNFFLPIIMQPIIYSKVSLPYKQPPSQNDIHIVGGFRVTVRKSTP